MNLFKNKNVVLLWILIFGIVAISVPLRCSIMSTESSNKKEGFYTYYGYYKRYCPSCGWRDPYSSCGKCTNCGTCITPNGKAECVPGDSAGPYFREDCQMWLYGTPYYNYPYSHIYPSTSLSKIYPYHRYRLRNPGRWRERKRWRYY